MAAATVVTTIDRASSQSEDQTTSISIEAMLNATMTTRASAGVASNITSWRAITIGTSRTGTLHRIHCAHATLRRAATATPIASTAAGASTRYPWPHPR